MSAGDATASCESQTAAHESQIANLGLEASFVVLRAVSLMFCSYFVAERVYLVTSTGKRLYFRPQISTPDSIVSAFVPTPHSSAEGYLDLMSKDCLRLPVETIPGLLVTRRKLALS